MSRILVIDDDRSVRHLISKVFEDTDVEVVAGATAEEGLQQLAANPPDAVLLDILLPNTSGLEVFDQIRATDPKLPVIFITAYPDRLLTGERPEPAFLITKPYQPDTVKAIVSQALFFERRAHLRDRTQMSA